MYSYGWIPGVYRWLFPSAYTYNPTGIFELSPLDNFGALTLLRVIWIAAQTLRRNAPR